ncbi:S-adenosyl-L-methionine-dependent methyltransferase [Scheffersomyces amazonensis]|uniref:S-adenosyl-L-methionine-dependent methyltransferase n=1 Tax=Scheffersomyces amazonensis TaxID=1078765 RepID=UPI00315CDF24
MSIPKAATTALFQNFKGGRGQSLFKGIIGEDVCQKILERLNLKEKYPNSKNLEILDIYPSQPLLSIKIHEELNPKTHVVLEDKKKKIGPWTELIDAWKQYTNIDNLKLTTKDGWNWETYDEIIEEKLLTPEIKSRDTIHDELLILGNLSPVKFGEPLFAQWIMCCAYANWLQRFGRVRIIALIPAVTAQKFLSEPEFIKRNKSSVKRNLYTNINLIAITGPATSDDNPGLGYDPRVIIEQQPIVIPRAAVFPNDAEIAVVELEPKNFNSANIEEYEHILTQLFINSNSKVKNLLSYIAVGADDDLAPLLSDELLNKAPRDLKMDEWHQLFNVFNTWAFKPSYIDRMAFLQEND